MEDLAAFTALNHSGSFGKNFVKFKKNTYVISQLQALLSHDLCRQQELEVCITLHYLKPEIFSSNFKAQ